jgi:hypothetical protein
MLLAVTSNLFGTTILTFFLFDYRQILTTIATNSLILTYNIVAIAASISEKHPEKSVLN